MAKTEREIQELREKAEVLDKELRELSEEEFRQVTGGLIYAGNTVLIPAKGTGAPAAATIGPTGTK